MKSINFFYTYPIIESAINAMLKYISYIKKSSMGIIRPAAMPAYPFLGEGGNCVKFLG